MSSQFFTVWQHRHLSEQIRPWGTLACCGDVKKLTNKKAGGREGSGGGGGGHKVSVRQSLSASFSSTVFQLITMGSDVVLKHISCTSSQDI